LANVIFLAPIQPQPPSPEEITRRLWLTRPDPEWHVARAKQFADQNYTYAAALHRSFEQQARGIVACDYNQFDKAFWHFVAAAALKPKLPKCPETAPMKEPE
jgi:hypothetical protein